MNKAILIGRLVKDPEVTKTPNDVSVAKFMIAVDRRFGKNNEADFIPVTAWRGTADNCGKFLEKGKKVAVVGSIQTRQYEATDGSKRNAFEVVAEEVEFLTPKWESGENEQQKLTPMDEIDEELPF